MNTKSKEEPVSSETEAPKYPDLEQSTVVVVGINDGGLKIFTDLPDSVLLGLFSSAIKNVSLWDCAIEDAPFGVITFVCDVSRCVFLTSNVSPLKTRMVLMRLIKDVLISGVPSVQNVKGSKSGSALNAIRALRVGQKTSRK